MATFRCRAIALAILICAVAVPASASAPVLVRFSADDFWLNLHHFLYVLGRAQAGMRDAARPEVAGAPIEQEKGLASLTPSEQSAWRDAVTFYANGPSKQDTVFDDELVAVTGALARIGDGDALGDAQGVPAAIAETLRRAAPVYRKAWWPSHQRANHAWVVDTQKLVDQYGADIVAYLTRIYQLPWPADGYPVHVCAYTNWAGAYSTTGPLLVIASVDETGRGPAALETVFHEASHQWDDAILATLEEIGKSMGKRVPPGLTHAMIWMTAGEAVRRLIPGYVPLAEAGGLWKRGANPILRPWLDAAWRPYLDGRGTRDDALKAVMTLAQERNGRR